jgi:predicted Zn-dependent protease with MMP-like domain
MTEDEFTAEVEAVLAALPSPFQDLIADVTVVVMERPDRELRRSLGLKPWQRLYGAYVGVPLTERSGDLGGPPDAIYIFRHSLQRDFPGPATLREQIRITVLHEIAHHFGISDERLEQLGAY